MTLHESGPVLADLIDFTWYRSPGARWIEDVETFNEAMTSLDPDWCGWDSMDSPTLFATKGVRYQPLRDHPALFREFVGLSGSADAYAAFADRYGPLDSYIEFGSGERIGDWKHHHRRMQDAFALFMALKQRGEARVVASMSDPATHSRGEVRTFGSLHGLDVSGLSPREIVQSMLAQQIQLTMWNERVAPALVMNQSPFGTGLRLTYGADNLIGAMWLQFAFAVDGDRTYRDCPVCGKWWDATEARSHKAVCSDKCRAKKSYNARKKREEAAKSTEGGGETS